MEPCMRGHTQERRSARHVPDGVEMRVVQHEAARVCDTGSQAGQRGVDLGLVRVGGVVRLEGVALGDGLLLCWEAGCQTID